MDDESLEYNIKKYKTWEEFVQSLNASYASLPLADHPEMQCVRSDIQEYLRYIVDVTVPEAHLKLVQDFCSEIIHEVIKLTEYISKSPSEMTLDFETLSLRTIFEKLRCKCDEKIEKRERDKLETVAEDVIKIIKDFDTEEVESCSEESLMAEIKKEVKKWDINAPCVEEPIDFRSSKVNLKEFLSVHTIASLFVDDILRSAVHRLKDGSLNIESIRSIHPLHILTSGEFTPILGKKFIEKVVSFWVMNEGWKYCVDLIDNHTDSCCDFYIYEVRWSIPTKSYPIPQATASVFFTVEVSRIKPSRCPIKVAYSFEGQRCKYTLKNEIQQEKIIADIVVSKLALFKTIKF